MQLDHDKLMAFAIGQAQAAGAVMRRYFDAEDKGVAMKPDHTSVTVADNQINEDLIKAVRAAFPGHGVYAEEASFDTDKSQLWVCDPIDGTKGFILGIPTAMYSLAFVVDGVPQVAVCYDPFTDRLYTAIKGRGACKNGKPIHVDAAKRTLEGADITITDRFRTLFTHQAMYDYLSSRSAHVEKFPGAVIKSSLVAEGKFCGHIFPGDGAHDIAASKLIVEEAGGRVTNLLGKSQRYDQKIFGAIVSNGYIHDELVAAVAATGADQYVSFRESI